MNGNPVRCLLEDGLPGAQHLPDRPRPLRQHAGRCTTTRCAAGIGIFGHRRGARRRASRPRSTRALERLSHVEAILVDFDIDVIDRAQLPGAPGARPGGLPVARCSSAPRAGSPRRRGSAWSTSPNSIPSLDVSDISALTAGRWVCEILAGYTMRAP